METKIIRNKYYQKAMESFNTRLDLFLFNRIIEKQCIDDFSIGDFEDFQITDNLIKKYATQYYQLEYNIELVKDIKINDIYNKMKEWKKKPESEDFNSLRTHYWLNMFPISFPFEDFHDLFTKKEQKCHYCGITYEMISSLRVKGEIFNKRDTRGFSMEIDRKEPNKEYTSGNSVLSCYWCNNAKTDEFFYDEFKPIIGESFRLLWNKRLAKHNLELIPDPPSQK